MPLGLLIGVAALVAAAAHAGVRLAFLWQPSALLVVFGGTLGAVIVRRNVRAVFAAARSMFGLMLKPEQDACADEAVKLAWLARAARRDGVRVYETHAGQSRDPLVSTALALAADRANPKLVRTTLERILSREDETGLQDAATLEAAGGYAPTFGILGAVLGLIGVLGALDNPSALGGGIATAFVATLYGLGAANLLFFPVAARLRLRHSLQMRRREALADALVALSASELPSAIAERYAAHDISADQTTRTRLRAVSR